MECLLVCSSRDREFDVPRVVSVIVLIAILLLMGAVFFQVMAHFVVPLFLASVLVVVFKPLHAAVIDHLPGYPRLSALVTTLLILLAVLLPTVWLGWRAALECRDVYAYLTAKPESVEVLDVTSTTVDAEPEATAPGTEAGVDSSPADAIAATDSAGVDADEGVRTEVLETIESRTPAFGKRVYKTLTGKSFDRDAVRTLLNNARGAIGAVALSGAQVAVKLLFGLAIMVLALYYFLADGPKMLANLMKLSPLDDEYERELLDKFANISRAVVVASLASAVAQGLLAGIGYYFALNVDAPIFLLTMLTMVLAIVPFAGAAAVWVPTAAWIYLYQPLSENGKLLVDAHGKPLEGDTFSAIGLAIYGVAVVSAIDNVIKPLVLHGQSNLHPLVALISILGGVQTLGPIGILVGPMLVAFIQALLNMINKELHRFGDGMLESKHGARGVPLPLGAATAVEAQAVAVSSGGIIDKLASAVAEAQNRSDSPSPPAEAVARPTAKRSKRRK
jgi:predicted PurR-regulated permease PerM